MKDGFTFLELERAAEPAGRDSGWTQTGAGERTGRWLVSSEYHRLIQQERREALAAFLGVLTAFGCFAAIVYLVS